MNSKFLVIIASTLLLSSCGVFKSNKKVITVPKEQPAQTVTPIKHTDASKLDGEWTVWTVGGKKVTGEERPYVNFSVSEGRIYGNNGCNTVNGNFTTGEGQTLRISNVISTMMACADAPFEAAINQALENARYFTVSKQGHELYLDLLYASKHTIMVLRRHNMEFLNGAWTPIEIGAKPNANTEVEMVIDIAEQKVHGRTGCNIMNGSLLIDPDKTNSIQFLDIATTRMMCEREQMATETALLVALESVEHAKTGKNGTVVMTDKDGKTVLVLKHIDLPQP